MADDRVADEELWVKVDFSQDGNNAEFRGQGWSGQEKNHIWTVGATSELIFRQIPEHGGLRAKLTIGPFIATPAPRVQRLTILANGLEVGYFALTKSDDIEFTIPEAAIQGQQRLLLEFLHPDAARPSDAIPPTGDGRLLALAFRGLELRRLPVASESPAQPVSDGAAPIVPADQPAEPLADAPATAEPEAAGSPAEAAAPVDQAAEPFVDAPAAAQPEPAGSPAEAAAPVDQAAEPFVDAPAAAQPEPAAAIAEPVAAESPAEAVVPAEQAAEPETAAVVVSVPAAPQPDSVPASKTTPRADIGNSLLATLFPWIKWR